MLAQLILDRARLHLPTDTKAECVAVIRGVKPAVARKPTIIVAFGTRIAATFVFGKDQYAPEARDL